MKKKYYAALIVVILLVVGIGIWHDNKKQHEEQEQIAKNKQYVAHGNGNIKSKTYNLADEFSSLYVENNNADIIIKVFEELSAPSIIVTTDSNLLDHIKTELKNNKVSVVVEENARPTKVIICEIGVKSLGGISVKGDGNVKFEGILIGTRSSKYESINSLSLTHSGSGALELTINTGEVKFDADDSHGNVVVKGQTMGWFVIFNSGKGGKFDLSELASPDIRVDGSGLIIVKPKKDLSASMEEPGEVMYIRNNSNPLIIRNFVGPFQDGGLK